MWKSFFEEMEKRAIAGAIMPLAMGAFAVNDINSRIKENKEKMSLSQNQGSQFKLSSPTDYQFEGGKHTDLKNTVTPNMSMYRED